MNRVINFFNDRFTLRPMSVDDLTQVYDIECLSQPYPWSKTLIEQSLAHPAWVVMDESRVIGFMMVMVVLDEVHLLNIAIHPSYRRQGVATQLLSFLDDFAHRSNCLSIFLELRVSNQAALSVYLTGGYQQISLRRAYYQGTHGREDAIIMRKDLMRASWVQ